MEQAEENSKADMHDLRKEAILNAAMPAGAANMSEQDDDPELQYLDQTDKINNSKKKSFFQITSVIENVNDENDSMDELDESRADDLSTADLSKLSLQTDVEQSETDDSPAPPGSALNPNAALNPIIVESNGNGPSRFKLVKVARIEPIKRGRWTCKDFSNEPQAGVESTVAKTEQLKDNVSGSSSAASSVHYVPGENPPTDNPLNDNMNSAPQQPPLQPPPPSNDKTSEEATSSRSKKDNPTSMTNHRPSNKTGSPKEVLSKRESSAGDLLSLDLLNVDHAENQSEGNESTSATGGAIDNKIEQAMDLVKSHLLFAVREEVEILKEQIKELLEKNEQLQRENARLRQSQTQAVHRSYNQSEAPPPSLPPQHIAAPKPAQDQAGFPATPAAAAPRTDGYAQQQQQPTPVGLQTAGGPAHGQAPPPSQPQALPQQQASQYGHLQPTQPPQAQQQHTLPQQTTQQPPSQT